MLAVVVVVVVELWSPFSVDATPMATSRESNNELTYLAWKTSKSPIFVLKWDNIIDFQHTRLLLSTILSIFNDFYEDNNLGFKYLKKIQS